jgi:hypothetical protein
VAARPLSLAVAGVGLAAAAVLFAVGGGSEPAGAPAEVARLGVELDAQPREMGAALRARASTLADLPRLAVAVATDAATVQDLTEEELAFRLKPGETIEIGQIKGGQTISLLRKPPESDAAPPLHRPGPTLMPAGGGFLLAEVVSITPSVQTGVERGALAVSWFLDARPLLARVGAPARIELGGQPIAESQAPFAAGRPTVEHPVPGELAAGVVIVTQPVGGGAAAFSPLRLLAFVIAGIAVVLALGLWRRGARPPAAATSALPAVAEPVSPLAPAAGPASEAPASQLGRYSIVRRLGSGGMAEVYLARVSGEAGFEKDVALKIMHKNLAQLEDVVAHFLDEARLATRLSHPNIVQIFDLGRAGEDYFIAMEYVEGYDLDHLLEVAHQRGALVPVRVAIAITRKICDGLHAAHTAVAADGSPLDIVHRDVKAENVLISRRGEVKVADFGIAKANQRSRVTQLGMVKGTAAYMAPEHRVGRPVDRRADVYGVGAVLYELLSGTEINLDLENLAHLGREGWPHLTPVSTLRADVTPELDAIIWKALAFDREQRHPTCAALEQALEDLAVRHGLEVGDKAIVQWVEEQLAYLEGRSATNAAPGS